jgi:hypothetical protein
VSISNYSFSLAVSLLVVLVERSSSAFFACGELVEPWPQIRFGGTAARTGDEAACLGRSDEAFGESAAQNGNQCT